MYDSDSEVELSWAVTVKYATAVVLPEQIAGVGLVAAGATVNVEGGRTVTNACAGVLAHPVPVRLALITVSSQPEPGLEQVTLTTCLDQPPAGTTWSTGAPPGQVVVRVWLAVALTVKTAVAVVSSAQTDAEVGTTVPQGSGPEELPAQQNSTKNC